MSELSPLQHEKRLKTKTVTYFRSLKNIYEQKRHCIQWLLYLMIYKIFFLLSKKQLKITTYFYMRSLNLPNTSAMGNSLSGVRLVWRQSFSSPREIVLNGLRTQSALLFTHITKRRERDGFLFFPGYLREEKHERFICKIEVSETNYTILVPWLTP